MKRGKVIAEVYPVEYAPYGYKMWDSLPKN